MIPTPGLAGVGMKLIGGIGADPAVCRHPKGIGLFLAGRDDSDIFAHACGLLPSVYRQHYHTSTGIAITIPTQIGRAHV